MTLYAPQTERVQASKTMVRFDSVPRHELFALVGDTRSVAIERGAGLVGLFALRLFVHQNSEQVDDSPHGRKLIGGNSVKKPLHRSFDGALVRMIQRAPLRGKAQRCTALVARVASALEQSFTLQATERRRYGAGIDVEQIREMAGRHAGIFSDAAEDQPLLDGNTEPLLHTARNLLERVVQLPESLKKIERRPEPVALA